MKIEFVSDVACPWCAVGLHSLEKAIAEVGDTIPVELHFEPFELNPTMPPEGEDAIRYLSKKYGAPPEQLRALMLDKVRELPNDIPGLYRASIEHAEQLGFFIEQQCAEWQGFFLVRPVTAVECEGVLFSPARQGGYAPVLAERSAV